MNGALMAALNTSAGDSVKAFLDVALSNYRLSTGRENQTKGPTAKFLSRPRDSALEST